MYIIDWVLIGHTEPVLCTMPQEACGVSECTFCVTATEHGMIKNDNLNDD